MASSGDVKVTPEPSMEVEQLAEAYDGGRASEASTTTEESGAGMVQEHSGTAVHEPDHHEAAAPEPAAAPEEPEEEEMRPVAAAAPEEPEEKEMRPVAAAAPEEEEMRPVAAKKEGEVMKTTGDQESTRERLKRHRQEMAGRVWVPEMWGQEKLLKDWVDCAVFDRPLVPAGLLTARRALVAECCTRRQDRRTAAGGSSSPLRVQNGCS
ncbi:hypothetical protein ACP4OV_010167 [Aristida adscensionis]